MVNMVDELASWIRREAETRGWSLREVARCAGVSHTAIINVANGRTRPGAHFCLRIAQALHVPPEEVYRRAGLLPPVSAESAALLEANFLFAQLSDNEQETVLTMMRALAEKRHEAPHALGSEAG